MLPGQPDSGKLAIAMKSSTRKHAHPALAAFLAISACQGILPAHCFDVKDAEFNVRESEKEANTCPSYYAHCLLILATEYWRIGQANKADRIFRKSIPVAVRSQYVDEGDLKAHLQMWAQLLAEGRDYNGVKKEDFHRLDKATKHVLSETEKHSTLEEKLNAYTFAVQFFDKTGNWKLKNKYKPILLDYCEKVENDSAAIQKDCLKAAAILGGLAEVEFPVGKLNAMPDHAIEIQPDTNTGSKQTRSRFAEAD